MFFVHYFYTPLALLRVQNSPIKWIEVIDWAPSLSHGVKDTDQNPTTSENQAQTKRTDLKHIAYGPLVVTLFFEIIFKS